MAPGDTTVGRTPILPDPKEKAPVKAGILLPGQLLWRFGSRRRRRIRFRIPDLPNRPSSGKINRNYGDYG
jgi:hypothetical protein